MLFSGTVFVLVFLPLLLLLYFLWQLRRMLYVQLDFRIHGKCSSYTENIWRYFWNGVICNSIGSYQNLVCKAWAQHYQLFAWQHDWCHYLLSCNWSVRQHDAFLHGMRSDRMFYLYAVAGNLDFNGRKNAKSGRGCLCTYGRRR